MYGLKNYFVFYSCRSSYLFLPFFFSARLSDAHLFERCLTSCCACLFCLSFLSSCEQVYFFQRICRSTACQARSEAHRRASSQRPPPKNNDMKGQAETSIGRCGSRQTSQDFSGTGGMIRIRKSALAQSHSKQFGGGSCGDPWLIMHASVVVSCLKMTATGGQFTIDPAVGTRFWCV